jgi:hypothetical protein
MKLSLHYKLKALYHFQHKLMIIKCTQLNIDIEEDEVLLKTMKEMSLFN